MITIKRSTMNPAERAEMENTIAREQRNADLIEYLAMMADIDIPTNEETEETADE